MRTVSRDPLFGEIVVDLDRDGGVVRVEGESVPPGVLHRTGVDGLRTDVLRTDVPIGTRESSRLRLAVDGQQHDLRVGPGRIARRSYRIRTDGPGGVRLFAPASADAHRLIRGERYTGHDEIGRFVLEESSTDSSSVVVVDWSEEIRVAGAVARAAAPTPMDSTIGHLLAASFGTGARLMVVAVVSGLVDSVFPN
ncbi:hypothetical protein [Gordonia soli]|uniref:Uncharacterized protein n=1 Tax=Gordonia soli NBRC 108243 TaxID=1223545 RepID=M0QMI4_9ACTN|nr:hypothetical protein [Gordonia soli]GAC69783.1 hypothetical protein GS4_28_00310 [Gordonia soli NBRC 108243]